MGECVGVLTGVGSDSERLEMAGVLWFSGSRHRLMKSVNFPGHAFEWNGEPSGGVKSQLAVLGVMLRCDGISS